MKNPVKKLITRSFPCSTMRERFAAAGAKEYGTMTRGCNNVVTHYRGKHNGIWYYVTFDFTRHTGDFTYLVLDQDDFPSKAALIRFYREIKDATTHTRYGEGANIDWSK